MLCDLTNDPAAVFKHYDYFCILPTWDCIAITNLFYLLFDRLPGEEPNFYDCASRPSPRVSQMLPSFWLLSCPSSTESKEAEATPGEGVWTCSRFWAGKQVKSGYLGWWNPFRALVAFKVAIKASWKKATRRMRPTSLTWTPRSSLYTPRKTPSDSFLISNKIFSSSIN